MPVLAFGLAASAAGAQQEPPEFGVRTELVQIDAVVLDGDGNPVTGLSAEDFEVQENGEVQPIVSFQAVRLQPQAEPVPDAQISEPQPLVPDETRYLVFYFDDTHLSTVSVEQIEQSLGPFLAERLGDQDRVTLVAPRSGVYWTSRCREEHRRLPEVLARLHGEFTRYPFDHSPSEWRAMQQVELSGSATRSTSSQASRGYEETTSAPRGGGLPTTHIPKPEEVYEVAKRRLRGTLSGLSDVIARLAPMKGRKSVLLYSEGFVHPPYLHEFEALVDLARRANVAVEFVNPQAMRRGEATGFDSGDEFEMSPLGKLETGVGGAAFVANATGGRSVISNDLTQAVRTVIRESSAYYLIGYPPPNGGRGERRVSVRVRRPGLKVRARSRYYVGASLPEDAPELSADERALRALDDADALDVRVRTLSGDPGPNGAVGTTLVLEIPPPARPRARRLKLTVEARPLAGGEPFHDAAMIRIPATSRAVRATRDWSLAPGVWQARIVVEDLDTGDMGSLLHTFEVASGPEVGP